MLTKRDKIKGIVAELAGCTVDITMALEYGHDHVPHRKEVERLWKELEAELDTLLTSE
jgi:hypothetical protein